MRNSVFYSAIPHNNIIRSLQAVKNCFSLFLSFEVVRLHDMARFCEVCVLYIIGFCEVSCTIPHQ